MIVPTLLRGNAAQGAPHPLLNVTQSVSGGMPMQTIGTINPHEHESRPLICPLTFTA